MGRLCLSRLVEESIRIGDNIIIKVVQIDRNKVRLLIEAPAEVSIHRSEVYDAIQEGNAHGNKAT